MSSLLKAESKATPHYIWFEKSNACCHNLTSKEIKLTLVIHSALDFPSPPFNSFSIFSSSKMSKHHDHKEKSKTQLRAESKAPTGKQQCNGYTFQIRKAIETFHAFLKYLGALF